MNLPRLCRRLVITLAIAFLLSAWLYCLATIRAPRLVDAPQRVEQATGLIAFFCDHGAGVLLAELVALAACATALVVTERRASVDRKGTDPSTGPRRPQ